MKFDAPFVLALLLLLPVLGAYWGHRCKVAAKRLGRLARGAAVEPKFSKAQMGLIAVALALEIVALAGPRWGKRTEERLTQSRNVMVAIDVSRSMLAEDVRPNRLARARADVIDLVEGVRGDRVGVLAFWGGAAVLCPMTTDTAFLRQAVDGLTPESAPAGPTNLADAIQKCLDAFSLAQSSHNAIVLISDGEDLAGKALEAAKAAGERQIPIFTVGIGSTQGAAIPTASGTLRFEGKEVRTALTESTLQQIASASGGKYIPIATSGTATTTLAAVYERYVSQLEAEEAREALEMAYVDRTAGFAVLGALLLVIAGALSLGRISRRRALACVGALMAVSVWAEPPAREAQKAWQAGDYEGAARQYAEARLSAEPLEMAHYAYNEALALWKMGDVTNALERVELATPSPDFKARAHTLEGTLLLAQASTATNAVSRLELEERALEAFTRSLQAEPTEVARRNVRRVQDRLPEARLAARKERAMAQYGSVPLPMLTRVIRDEQRALAKALPEVRDFRSPSLRLTHAQQLSEKVCEQADRLFPVLDVMPQVITNEVVCAEVMRQTQEAQGALDGAALRYREVKLEDKALDEGEAYAYTLWKTFADPPGVVEEAIVLQEHAQDGDAMLYAPRDDQTEVRSLMEQFGLIFPPWAEQVIQQQAANTNAVPFTVEDKAAIEEMTKDVLKRLEPPVALPARPGILETLKEIRERLPKQQSSQSQENQEQNQQQQEQQQQSGADQQQQSGSEEEQQAQAQPQESQEEQPPQQAEAQEPTAEEAEEQDLNALLQKADDRNREHEKEKQRQMRVPTADPRDW